ncbi:dihydroxyacetone kinase [Flexivirga endophytica]|uniref:Dihydroxyacetone kinase n=1 Tax=Flexivirga endophytica TaxID=1849103 RepID=A0A916WYJ6_9MICO|nr:dihydroxyacetone kinase [Flexivirga endophytica]GHB47753.1 dihydroxyacetone kinase [Flexivirga endophytica]
MGTPQGHVAYGNCTIVAEAVPGLQNGGVDQARLGVSVPAPGKVPKRLMPLAHLDLAALRRWVITARADLAAYAEALNSLNVFPVPDGDTGSNLLMTMSDAVDEIDRRAPETLVSATRDMAQATLTAARGNSGVILSQLSCGVSEVVEADGGETLAAHQLARVLTRAAQLAQDGVSVPVPGTILTVAAAAASTAERADGAGADLVGVIDAAVAGAGEALLRTRIDNPVLCRAGVVDAGGAGYLLVLEALQRVVHGEGGLAVTGGTEPEWLRISRDAAGSGVAELPVDCGDHAPADGPSYEVMFLLEKTSDDAVGELKATLHDLGDSLVVAGGPDRFSVHVHVDDVAAAVNAGVDAGRAHRFRITRFADQPSVQTPEFVVLALAHGQGVAHEFKRVGLTALTDWYDEEVLRSQLGRVGTLLLCTSPETFDAARGLTTDAMVVAVGRDAAQALAAAAVLDIDAGFDQMCAAAREAAADVASVRVVGDPGDDALMQQIRGAAEAVRGAELMTLVTGDGLTADRIDALLLAVATEHPTLDVTHVAGGVGEPLLTIGVE